MKPVIVMQSDFGTDSGLVSCMHGICKIVDPQLQIFDITHVLPAFDIEAASFCLQYTVPCWPEGTVFVSVVDPGVGTDRRASVAKLKNGSYVVTPDNGALTYLHQMIGVEEIREIDETVNRYPKTMEISVFHGRDLFSYCAARLASGLITFEEVGPEYPVEEIVLHKTYASCKKDNGVEGSILWFDPFGSAGTSIKNADLAQCGFKIGDKATVKIYDESTLLFEGTIPYEKSFGYVKKGNPVIFNGLTSFVTIAVNEGSFADRYRLNQDKVYRVEIIERGKNVDTEYS